MLFTPRKDWHNAIQTGISHSQDMEILIVTEKPEISRVLPKAFSGKFSKNGDMLVGEHEGVTIGIVATDGHILRLQQPQEMNPELKWHTPHLLTPIPARPGLLPDQGKRGITRLIKDKGRRAQEVIICTDPDMEGEVIGQDIANYCGIYQKCTRMLLNKSLEPTDVLAAFNRRNPLINHSPLYRAGQYKRESDWYWMFLVRAHTYAARNGMAGDELILNRDDKRVLSCGRVQGIILRLVGEWHLARRNHIPVVHGKLKAKTDLGTMAYIPPTPEGEDPRVSIAESGQIQILDIPKLESIKEQLSSVDALETSHVITKAIPESAPAPYEATTLMQAMAKAYKWSLTKTAQVADKVRFKGLMTYFRTDNNQLPTNYLDLEYLNPILDACALMPGMPQYVKALRESIQENGVSSTHITDKPLQHQAIAPSKASYLDKNLTEEEFLLYEMVVRQFVMSLMPKSVKLTTWVHAKAPISGVLDEESMHFVASQTQLQTLGWRKMKATSSESAPLAYLPEKGQSIKAMGFQLTEAVTEPKSPLTMIDLLQQMKNPSVLADNEQQLKTVRSCRGIGTAATRHSIYEKTKKRGYVLEDADRKIIPTAWGLHYLDYLHSDLVSVGLTERVELGIQEISNSQNDQEAVELRDKNLAGHREFITKHIKIALEEDERCYE